MLPVCAPDAIEIPPGAVMLVSVSSVTALICQRCHPDDIEHEPSEASPVPEMSLRLHQEKRRGEPAPGKTTMHFLQAGSPMLVVIPCPPSDLLCPGDPISTASPRYRAAAFPLSHWRARSGHGKKCRQFHGLDEN